MPRAVTPELRALGWVRVAIGCIFLVRTTPLFYLFPGLALHRGGPLFGWPAEGWAIAYAGLVLPAIVVKALCIVRTIAALLFTLGIGARPAGLVAAAAGYLVYAQEPFAFIFTLHVLYLATALLALTDARAVVALRPAPIESPESSLLLIRAFLASIYAWSAIAKLRPEWLHGDTLGALYQDGDAVGFLADALFRDPHVRVVVAWGVVLLEASLGPLLLLRRTRPAALVIACIAHASFEVALHPDVFGWVAVALLGSFFPARAAAPLPAATPLTRGS